MESNCKLKLKMFYKTQTAHKLPSACTPITPSPPTAMEWTRFLPVFCSVRRRPYNEDDSAVFLFFFVPCDIDFDLDIQSRPNEEPNTSPL